MSPLNTTHHGTTDGTVLRVTGDLDYEHAPALREYVEELVLAPGECLVIDLSGLTFCDSSGITALLAARRRTQTAGADIALANVPPNTLRILAVVGLDQVFTIHSDRGTA